MTHTQLQQLLHSMSPAEKALQLCQVDISFFLKDAAAGTGPTAALNLPGGKLAGVGSVLCGSADAEALARVQRQIMEQSPHHVPALIMSDVVHGMRTIFPIPLATACAFDPPMTEAAARISAAETAASGVHVTFAPMADVSRDPRWGRCMESAGESVRLNADMAAATVRGFRGASLADPDTAACCVKHFAAYGRVEAGREYAPVDVCHVELFNVYFPPFQAALDAGCDMLMPAFTPVDREPAVMNRWLMQTVLRRQWGFNGPVISDWGATAELVIHGVARDRREAAALCFAAGTDQDMMGMVYLNELLGLVEDGTIPMEALDAAVERVLKLKNALGLFETPCKNTSNKRQDAVCARPAHREAALHAAVKSCVLLKNDNALPLKNIHKTALLGDMADTRGILGGWAAGGRAEETPTLREACPECCAPENADVVLFAVGEPQYETGESASKTAPKLNAEQMKELRMLHALGRQIVLVLFCGRPFILTGVLPLCDAVLVAWFPGSEGAKAIRMLLTGQRNPSGRLAMSFPRSIGQIPIHHDSLTTARPDLGDTNNLYVSRYLDERDTPLFPFGYGLSYTDFAIQNVTVSASELREGETLTVDCDVQNTGSRDGETVVQLYLACEYSPRMHPRRELKGYKRVALQSGETKRVSLRVGQEDLTFYDPDGQPEIPRSRWFAAVGLDGAAPFNAEFRYAGP